MRALLVAVTAALLVPAPAAGHVDVRPGLLEAGAEVELRVELPELRAGATPTGLEVSGRGVEQLSSRADGRVGEETRWRVRVLVTAEPGPTAIVLRALFADGRSVDVRRTVTVVPAAADEGGPPLLAVAGAVLALAALAAAAIVLRRRVGGS